MEELESNESNDCGAIGKNIWQYKVNLNLFEMSRGHIAIILFLIACLGIDAWLMM